MGVIMQTIENAGVKPRSDKAERTERGSTERIRRLRRISVRECVPRVSMERALLLTEAYKKYEGAVSAPASGSSAMAHLLWHRAETSCSILILRRIGELAFFGEKRCFADSPCLKIDQLISARALSGLLEESRQTAARFPPK